MLVDDGFSHWSLERAVDLVLLDARDPWGGGRLLPAGRMREPRWALQRARAVVVSRLAAGEDPSPFYEQAARYAPAALLAAGRHRVRGVAGLDGRYLEPQGRAQVVTGTGNPRAVEASAREAGFVVTGLSIYHDHHAFTLGEARRELARAAAADACLLLTAKDAVRWPAAAGDARVRVLEVEWEWVHGGEAVERLVFEGEEGG